MEELDPSWLRGVPADPDLEALVELAAGACDVPTAVINLLDDRLQHQIAAIGFTPGQCAREDSMCAVSVVEPEPVAVVEDASLDPRFAQNPFVTGEIARVRCYAAAQLRTDAGEVLGTLCVFDTEPREISGRQRRTLELLAHQVVDVLELRRTARLLRETVTDLDHARTELTRSNAELAAFAGQVSHDLRGPLSVVAGYLGTLGDLPEVESSPAAARMVARADAAADRMGGVLEKLLAYARLGGTLKRRPVSLGELVREAAEDAGVVDGLVAGELPTVRVDSTQLRMVLQNVLHNARKFAHPDRPLRIRVGAERRVDGWQVEIADNGIGIDPARCDEALLPLARVHDPEQLPDQDPGGYGIGLATAVRIVSAHGGSFGIEPAPELGVVVWFTLPD